MSLDRLDRTEGGKNKPLLVLNSQPVSMEKINFSAFGKEFERLETEKELLIEPL